MIRHFAWFNTQFGCCNSVFYAFFTVKSLKPTILDSAESLFRRFFLGWAQATVVRDHASRGEENLWPRVATLLPACQIEGSTRSFDACLACFLSPCMPVLLQLMISSMFHHVPISPAVRII